LENQRDSWRGGTFGYETHHSDLQNRKDGSEATTFRAQLIAS
jgi:hypothetical protein